MDKAHEFSSLVGDIYDCALVPERWPQTLGKLALALGCERAILSLNDLRRDRVLIEESFGWEPRWLAERNKHLSEVHAVLQTWLAQGQDVDEPFVTTRELPASALLASPYVLDCLQPLGVVDVAHYFLLRSVSHFSEIVLMRQASEGPFGTREIEAGKLLLPHLRRAVTISNVLDSKTIEHQRLAQTLDALQCGVVLTDDRGTIVFANRAADEILRQGELLDGAAGVIRAKQPGVNQKLRHALRLGTRDEAGMGAAGLAIRLSQPDRPPTFAHVLPLGGSPLRLQLEPGAAAAVFVGPTLDRDEHITAFAAACGLTPAETRVVQALLSGHTLAEAAHVLGVGRATVKSQLDSIFRKTGVARQPELIRVVMQAASPIMPLPRASASRERAGPGASE